MATQSRYFADGLVEEIITALSRIKRLFVVARSSGGIPRGQTIDVKQIGQEMGVRCVLEGSVREAGGRVRITAQLIDAASGSRLWADRFDGSLDAVFELQDQVAVGVAGATERALQSSEFHRADDLSTLVTVREKYRQPASNLAGRRQLTVLSCNLANQRH